jgi:hypothetical protein
MQMTYRLRSYQLLHNFNPFLHHVNDDLVSVGPVRTLVDRLFVGRDDRGNSFIRSRCGRRWDSRMQLCLLKTSVWHLREVVARPRTPMKERSRERQMERKVILWRSPRQSGNHCRRPTITRLLASRKPLFKPLHQSREAPPDVALRAVFPGELAQDWGD